MRKPASMWSLETLGRVRLSKYFYMREFLYSEIGNIHRIQNISENPDLAIERGRAFCTNLLDPLEETFGRIGVRSGYRAPELNRFGNENRLNCARNEYPLECHIWDFENVEIAGASIASLGSKIVMPKGVTGVIWRIGFMTISLLRRPGFPQSSALSICLGAPTRPDG